MLLDNEVTLLSSNNKFEMHQYVSQPYSNSGFSNFGMYIAVEDSRIVV